MVPQHKQQHSSRLQSPRAHCTARHRLLQRRSHPRQEGSNGHHSFARQLEQVRISRSIIYWELLTRPEDHPRRVEWFFSSTWTTMAIQQATNKSSGVLTPAAFSFVLLPRSSVLARLTANAFSSLTTTGVLSMHLRTWDLRGKYLKPRRALLSPRPWHP